MSQSTLPKTIRNMMLSDYRKGIPTRESTERINKTATARNNRIMLTTQQVAAHRAWFTMRGE